MTNEHDNTGNDGTPPAPTGPAGRNDRGQDVILCKDAVIVSEMIFTERQVCLAANSVAEAGGDVHAWLSA